MDSPALSVHSDFSDMDDEELDKYLAQCVPLSNLPTPPAKEQPLPAASSLPSPPADEAQHQTPELEVYAAHLANLVPRNVSTRKPSAEVIAGFLERACLPVEVVAFAGCILDALSQRFASSLRVACLPKESNSRSCFGLNLWQRSTVSPDLIVLSALSLAHGFMDDCGRSNSHWARIEGGSLFTAKEVETTKMCILSDMDYGLFRIAENMVQRMVRDLQFAGNFTSYSPTTAATEKLEEERRPKLALSTETPGTAIWTHGVQTPEPSP